MKNRFIAIDESGDLGAGEKTSNFFVLCGFFYSDENIDRKIRKFITKINQNKSGNHINFLHAHRDSDKVKLKLVKFLNTLDFRVVAVVVNKKGKKVDYIQSLRTLLNELDFETVFLTPPTNNAYFVKKILSISNKIVVTTPAHQKSLQLADFVSWAIFRKVTQGDSMYFDLISKSVKLL